jgi:purine-binding chemotaxis protein CheW
MSNGEAPACCVLFTLHGQLCALPVEPVRDILDRYELTPVPLAPPEITGHLNLRGRVVTAIDLRRRLPSHGNDTPVDSTRQRAIVVEEQNTLYAFLVDDVREVLELPADRREGSPTSLDAAWGSFASCIYRLNDGLVAFLDPTRLLNFTAQAA